MKFWRKTPQVNMKIYPIYFLNPSSGSYCDDYSFQGKMSFIKMLRNDFPYPINSQCIGPILDFMSLNVLCQSEIQFEMAFHVDFGNLL